MPNLPEDYVKWYGEIYTPAYFTKKYGVTATHFNENIVQVLKGLGSTPLFVNKGINTDSDRMTNFADFEGIKEFTVEEDSLHPIISELRVFKTQYEIELLKWINWISSKAHVDVMQAVKPQMGEHQAESLYRHFMFGKGGCRHCCYAQICASGVDNACLHYPTNNKVMKDGDLALFDMGCEYSCYGSDITVTFPVNGKFTDEQKVIYNAVHASAEAVMEAMGPGISWVDMHVLANRVTLEHLKAAGLVVGDIDKMMEVHLAAVFQPHGLGHFLGLDVHDVGGYQKESPARPSAPGLRSLRTSRVLQPNMFITVEPGCYFNTISLEKHFQNPDWKPFLNEELIREKYWNVGGVRIEENVMVTETGCELYTQVPRNLEDVEKVVSGAEWKSQGTKKYTMSRKL
jgi:Xaa-Pro dipeptidase